jgi:hypothetical protein
MDTRDKIVTSAGAARLAEKWRAAGQEVQVAAGWFDPLLAEAAQALARVKRDGARLLVLLAEPSEAILGWRARAEMVAALRLVDAVAPLGEAELEVDVDFTSDHEALRARFIEHVLERMS